MVWTGFREECLFGGRRFCGLFTFREVKYCRRYVAVSEARWCVRRLSFGAVLCSWSVGVVGEGRRVCGSRFGTSPFSWFCCAVFYVFMYRSGKVGCVPAILMCVLFFSSCSHIFNIWRGW